MLWLILAALGGTVYLVSRASVNPVDQGNPFIVDSTTNATKGALPPLVPGRTYLLQLRVEGILPPANDIGQFILPEIQSKEILKRMGFNDPFVFVYPQNSVRVTPASQSPTGPVLIAEPAFNELTVIARFTGPFNPDSQLRMESYVDLGNSRTIQAVLLDKALNPPEAAVIYNALAYEKNSDNLGLLVETLRLRNPVPILSINLIQAKRVAIGDI